LIFLRAALNKAAINIKTASDADAVLKCLSG